jgi:hypothetical protein
MESAHAAEGEFLAQQDCIGSRPAAFGVWWAQPMGELLDERHGERLQLLNCYYWGLRGKG